MTTIGLRLIGTCPVADSVRSSAEYSSVIATTARWADEAGWEALLVYADHRQLDPWLLAQIIIQNTRQLRPLIAVQPLYLHPFALANNILTLALLHERQVLLNMVAGGFPRDLEAFCDGTPHDRRYDRVVEYAKIVIHLLARKEPISFSGEFYRVKNLQLRARLPSALMPDLLMSGSSGAGVGAAAQLNARAIQYLRPASEYSSQMFDPRVRHGTRLGIIVRDTSEEAWQTARRRYPDNPAGAAIRDYASRISDSVWVKELNREISTPEGHPYWLGPYRNAQSSCPFLVGSMSDVARELESYLRIGLRTFLLERPEDVEDSQRISAVFDLASRRTPMPMAAGVQ